MAYTSIGQLNTKAAPTLKYVPIPPVAPRAVTNKPVDVSAAFANRPSGYNARNTFSALGGALNKVLLQPVVNTAKIAPNAASLATAEATGNKKSITSSKKALTKSAQGSVIGPLADTAVLAGTNLAANSILNNKKTSAAEKSAQLKDAVNPSYNSAGFDLGQSKKSTILKGAALVGEDVLTAAGIKGAGEGLTSNLARNGIKSAKEAFINGPQRTLQNSITHVALKEGERANTPIKIPVGGEEGAASGVRVRTPVHAGVKDVSSTTKIGVRTPNQMSEGAFNTEFAKLNKGYERDTKNLEKFSKGTSTGETQATAQKIEDFYHGKINDLLDRFHNPELSAPTKPQTLATAITKARNYGGNINTPRRPRSALDPLVEQADAADKAALADQTAQVKADTTKPVETPQTAPKEPTVQTKTPSVPSGSQKTAGSALRTQKEAVEAGMKSEAQNTGATFTTVSHKEEAAKAVDLVQNDPEKAKAIAMGQTHGDNASHEAAVYHAVKNAEIEKAKKTGDWDTVTELANSQRHTGVSEAAQKLGAEGYNVDPHDPVSILNDIAKTRAQAAEKAGAPTVTKAAAEVKTAVKAETPRITKETWGSFIDGLKC